MSDFTIINYNQFINKQTNIVKQDNSVYTILYFIQSKKNSFLNLIESYINDEFIYEINYDIYLKQVLERTDSFPKQLYQFQLDFKRSSFLINNHPIISQSELQDFIQGTYGLEIYKQIISICSQILFVFLTEQIQLKLPGNYYVGEVSKKHIDLKNLIFNIIANDKIIIDINKHLRIFYINDETGDCETSVIFLLNIVIDLMNLSTTTVRIKRIY